MEGSKLSGLPGALPFGVSFLIGNMNRRETFEVGGVRKGIIKSSWCGSIPQVGTLRDPCRQPVNKDLSIACYVPSTRVGAGENWDSPGVGYCP